MVWRIFEHKLCIIALYLHLDDLVLVLLEWKNSFILFFFPLKSLPVMVSSYIFNNMGIKRSSLRCIFAESIWIKSKWILEKLFHPSHYVSVELVRKSLSLLVRSNTLKMPLCCQRYKTINTFHPPLPTESLNSYPSFGQNFREASTSTPREDFGPLTHRSITFG